MKKDCWNCKNDNQYAKFPCDYCHTGNIDDFWKPKDEMKDFAIEELEKIKADVINIADGRQSIKVKSVRNIIDRRIKELNNE